MNTPIYECTRCHTEYNGSAESLPPGWHKVNGAPICGDCNRFASFSAHSSVDRSGLHLGGPNLPATGSTTAKPKPSTLSALRSGAMIDLADPDYAVVHVRDIAAGLARETRFAGQIYGWWPVAAHSVVGSQIIGDEYAYDFLMHDGTEAIIKDIISPLKCLLPDYRRIEAMHEERLFTAFDVKMANKAAVKRIDMVMLAAENIAIRGYTEARAFEDLPRVDHGTARVAAAMIRGNIVGDWERAFLERFYQVAPMAVLERFNSKKEMAA